jgi:hypothetical protein
MTLVIPLLVLAGTTPPGGVCPSVVESDHLRPECPPQLAATSSRFLNSGISGDGSSR